MGMGRGRRRRGGGGGSSGRKRRIEEEEEEEAVEAGTGEDLTGEDYCFVCKDGGELRVCDFRSCNKAYHPGCVGKDGDFLTSDEEFVCEWHTCFICKGRSRYYCFCCPWQSFCKRCVAQGEFVTVLRKTKGFCINCLRLVIMIERNVDVDSDGERADFSDRETLEFLFKDYWEIVKDKEGLTLDKLEEAYASMKKGLNCKQAGVEIVPDEERKSDSDFLGSTDDGDDEPCYPSYSNGASKKIKSPLKQGKSKKNGHRDWGSEALMEFISSTGRDTSNSLDQFGAAQIVREYIQKNNLMPKDKKKPVICDDKLKSLFRKSKLRYNRICSLLKKHITANVLSEDETLTSSGDNNDSAKTKKSRTANYVSSTPKRTSEINKRCLASLESDNIKLIYLKRSLIVNLLKEPETFETKVTGCFVRIKNDPKEYSCYVLKKPYQLGLVTGIRKSTEEYKIRDLSTDVLLCISDVYDVRISMLSDEDFEKDECEDLHLMAKKGFLKRLTVGEIEEKARIMHRDIVNHGIDKELQILEKLINMAHEKGWRSEMYANMDKRKLLREPSERQRRLEEIPQVIPDKDSKDTGSQVPAEDKSIQKNAVDFQAIKDAAVGGGGTAVTIDQKQETEDTEVDAACEIPCAPKQKSEANSSNASGDMLGKHVQKGVEGDTGMEPKTIIDLEADENLRERGGQSALVDLEADDGRDTHPAQQLHETNNSLHTTGISLRMYMWYYIDPQGDEQGPFSVEQLRQWWDKAYFPDDFKVWRKGQTSAYAVFLRDLL